MGRTVRLGLLLGLLIAAPAWADARAEVYAAWDAMVAAKSYRAQIQTSSGGQTYQQTVEIIVPDRFRMIGGPGGDVVGTPQGAFIRLPGQDWTPAPPSVAEMSKSFMSAAYVEQAKRAITAVTALGTEVVAGKPARTYQVEQTMQVLDVESKTSTKLYVDIATGLPVRQEIDASARGNTAHTLQDISYESDLVIEAPK